MKKILLLIILLSFVFSKQNFDKKTSPILAMGLSAIIPGGGQFLNGDWEKGLIFLGVELISFNQKNKYNDIGENYISEYESYANEYWSADKWIKDFYLFKNPNYDIYKAFTNYGSDMQYCDQSNSENPLYCEDDNYLDIWDYSHNIEFTYDGSIMSSSSEEFKQVFRDLCGNNNIWDTGCSNDIVSLYDNNDDAISVIKDHHFYEGIGKYDMYTAGWDDNDSIDVITNDDGSKTAMTPHKLHYQGLYSNP